MKGIIRHLALVACFGVLLPGCRDRPRYWLYEIPTLPDVSVTSPEGLYRGLYAFADSPFFQKTESVQSVPPIIMCARDPDAMPHIITLDDQLTLLDFFSYDGLRHAVPVTLQDGALVVAAERGGTRLDCRGVLTGALLDLDCHVLSHGGRTHCHQVAQKLDY